MGRLEFRRALDSSEILPLVGPEAELLLVTEELDGFEPVAVEVLTTRGVGQTEPAVRERRPVTPREFAVRGWWVSTDLAFTQRRYARILGAAAARQPDGTLLRSVLRAEDDAGIYAIEVDCKQMRLPRQGGLNRSFEFVFLSQQAYWVAVAPKVVALAVGANTVQVDGDGPAPPRLTVTVPAGATLSAVSITSVTDRNRRVSYTGALVAGDVLVFDLDPRQQEVALLNGTTVATAGMAPGDRLWELWPRWSAIAGNSLTVAATYTGSAPAVSLSWYERLNTVAVDL